MRPILAIFVLVAAVSSLLAKEEPASIPPPVSNKVFSFQQIDQQKNNLKDKIVLVKITLVGEGGDIGKGVLRYFAKDTSGSAMPYLRPSRLPPRRLEQARATR